MRKVIPVVAALIIKGDYGSKEILLHYRDSGESPETVERWECPGGVMEYGESPESALRREIREELGVNISIFRLVHAQTNIYSSKKHYLVLYYQCNIWPEAEPKGCRWFRIRDLDKVVTLPGTQESIKKASV